MKIRVGFGYDVHALVPDRELWLGGIKIEHTLGEFAPTRTFRGHAGNKKK